MKISNPKELKRFLDEYGLTAKKSASQNFLIDGNIVRKIVAEAHLSPDDVVVEIGPGPGALTEELLETGCSVIAIEKDQELGSLLNRFATSEKRLSVYVEDFLKFDLSNLLKKKLAPGKKAKVVANLPYHITTPILEKLLPLNECISDLILMVQKEVAVRFVAPIGTKDYSSFTVFLQFFSKVSYCFTIEPSCFSPKPTVQSAVVHLTLTPPPEVKSREGFFAMTRTAFGKRRKMMKSSLKDLFPSKTIEASLKKMSLNPKIRPEELSLAQFIELYGILSNDLNRPQ